MLTWQLCVLKHGTGVAPAGLGEYNSMKISIWKVASLYINIAYTYFLKTISVLRLLGLEKAPKFNLLKKS